MSKKYLRQRRYFSPTLRKQIVGYIESGRFSVSAASREYLVTRASIYRWIHRYSTYNTKGTLLVIVLYAKESPKLFGCTTIQNHTGGCLAGCLRINLSKNVIKGAILIIASIFGRN